MYNLFLRLFLHHAALLTAALASEPLVEVVEPLRSAPLHHFLSWEASLFMSEAAMRESFEVQLHDAMQRLRKLIFDSQDKIWAAADMEQLRIQVLQSRTGVLEVVLKLERSKNQHQSEHADCNVNET